jgi:recombinational DNA repair ATPase RecF
MILAAAETAQSALGRPLLLLLDDPGAELDGEALARLMSRVVTLGSQVIATSLDPKTVLFPADAKTFHVEHGVLQEMPIIP